MSIFTKDILKLKVKEGTDNNILAYDKSAKVGEITDKLLYIMTVTMLKGMTHPEQCDELKYIFSPYGLPPVNLLFTDQRPFYDVQFFIGEEYDYTNFFLTLEGDGQTALAHDDKYLVIGIGKNGHVLLGSF